VVRRRLDTELVRRRLATSRHQARALVERGVVLVSGTSADKAGRLVDEAEPVVVLSSGPRFVSRGGEKLDAALAGFAVEVGGRRALDAGASAGGFTDCLLQHGAASVVAVDVGYGQLHPRLRADPRVRVLERTNVRHLDASAAGGPFEVVVGDLSFISLATVAPVLAGELASPGADLVLLVKPQFEVGRRDVGRGRGVVRDPALWRLALEGAACALGAAGASIMGAMASPLVGPAGNVEFFLHARAHARSLCAPASPPAPLSVLVEAALAQASAGRHSRSAG
jgi:23S rRNA (cytidine1920-2'-O)/16S rRNA (cytidine1409-2'-O)-methyltransferase